MASGLDQETALELVKKGGTLLLLDVPKLTLFGIDTQMFYVGPNFKGIKMLPPGPHFVYYCSSNKEGHEFSPTISFFLNVHPSEVIIRKWCQREEQLIKVSEDEECRYSEMVKQMEFDQYLGPYPLDHYGIWKRLSCYISESTISRIEPIGAEISIAHESALFDQEQKAEMGKRLLAQLKNSRFSECPLEKTVKRGCFYTTIPKIVKQKNITGEELTALNLDKVKLSVIQGLSEVRLGVLLSVLFSFVQTIQTKLLENILMTNFGGEEDLLLGELQFSFIAFMMGQSLEAFIQWKDLVSLFFSCTEAPLRTRSQLFTKFVIVIYFQLKHGFRKEQKGNIVDAGLSLFIDDDWLSKDIFLYHLCMEFFPLVLNAEVIDGDLLSWTRKLKKLLETTFGWDFADLDEDDEFAPVVVPSTEATAVSHECQAS